MPLDTRGDFYDGTPISNLEELSSVVLKRPILLLRNFTVNLMAYAVGRRVEYYDQPTIRAIVREAEANGYKMSSFVSGRREEPRVPDDEDERCRARCWRELNEVANV